MPMIEIPQETFELLQQAARYEIMYDREADDYGEAKPEDLANAILWQATQDVIRKHRAQDNLRIGPLPDEMDDQIPF